MKNIFNQLFFFPHLKHLFLTCSTVGAHFPRTANLSLTLATRVSKVCETVRTDDIIVFDDSVTIVTRQWNIERLLCEFSIFLLDIIFETREILIYFCEKLFICIFPRTNDDVDEESKRGWKNLKKLADESIYLTFSASSDITSYPKKQHYPYQEIIPSSKYE